MTIDVLTFLSRMVSVGQRCMNNWTSVSRQWAISIQLCLDLCFLGSYFLILLHAVRFQTLAGFAILQQIVVRIGMVHVLLCCSLLFFHVWLLATDHSGSYDIIHAVLFGLGFYMDYYMRIHTVCRLPERPIPKGNIWSPGDLNVLVIMHRGHHGI